MRALASSTNIQQLIEEGSHVWQLLLLGVCYPDLICLQAEENGGLKLLWAILVSDPLRAITLKGPVGLAPWKRRDWRGVGQGRIPEQWPGLCPVFQSSKIQFCNWFWTALKMHFLLQRKL